jgi:Tfp pilus assembly protein PilE
MESRMSYKKINAFTLLEIMVILLTLSILMAAFSPIFTKRYSDGARDEVWTYILANSNGDSYYDATNKTYPAQAFIGLTPSNKLDVSKFSQNEEKESIYSKLVIGAAKNAKINPLTRKMQNQIQFRYGKSSAGDLVGSLFAGNGNLLFGGPYSKIYSNAIDNTAYGIGALENLTSGEYNTAAGYNALKKLSSSSYNTAVGAYAGENSTGLGNTFLGLNAGTNSSADYNTLIGEYAGYSVSNSYNTAIGYSALKTGGGEKNTAIGHSALSSLTSGSSNNGNTAVGFGSMKNLESGENNTAIGANSCNFMENTSNKTCIGATSGSSSVNSIGGATDTRSKKSSMPSALYSDKQERIYIGAIPLHTLDYKPMAVLEIHNVTGSTNSKSLPNKGAGNPSVVINGNLIVRGQSYLTTPIIRPKHLLSKTQAESTYKGLVAYKLMQANNGNSQKGFAGYDGMYRTGRSMANCAGCNRHKSEDIRTNCICTVKSGSTDAAIGTSYTPSTDQALSTSYDWSTKTTGFSNNDSCSSQNDFGASYIDASIGGSVTLVKNDSPGNGTSYEADRPLAHLRVTESCCPVLTSDIRLKNVGTKFTAGITELKNLNFYNYTFKKDPNKIPQVGVIAQDLKLTFPDAVFKGEDGYLKIRWDEMLYATVNSLKTLYSRFENLTARIRNDKERISNLKKENQELNKKLDNLEAELTELEARKK